MKIGIDISQIVYDTGVSNYTKELVRHLLKIDRKNQYVLFGVSLRLYFKLKKFARELSDFKNVESKIYPLPPLISEIIFNRMRIIPIEKFIGEVDIFHSSDWTQPRVASPSTKKVTTVHDMIVYLFPSSLHPKIVKVHKRRLARVKSDADLIIADSQTTKEDLVKFVEISEDKIKVVYLAASEEFKPQDEDKIREVLEKYKIKKPYILSVSTWEPRKNIQKLIDAFFKIREERPNFNLVLTGKSGWGPQFSSQDRDAGGKIIFTGFAAQEDLPAIYSGCRVFVYPSLYEGFGLPILEAAACGSPVITSNNSSMAEIAKDAAILIDPRSEGQLIRAIKMVLGLNLENYQKMVRASLDRARKYSWIRTARETLRIYEEVVRAG